MLQGVIVEKRQHDLLDNACVVMQPVAKIRRIAAESAHARTWPYATQDPGSRKRRHSAFATQVAAIAAFARARTARAAQPG